MSVTVRIPTILRAYTGGASNVTVEGKSLKAVIENLDEQAPGITPRLLADDGKLRRFINVYINDDDVRFLDGLDSETPDGATVSVIPAVAGGCC
jgi:molybdopterin synthase sulfur carrier subunit